MAVLALAAGCATGGRAATSPNVVPTTSGPPAATSPGAGPSTARTSATPAVTSAGCNGTTVVRQGRDGFPEVRGVATDAELWGLLFAPVPFRRGEEIKIVWRMTGEGPLKVTATLPDGTRARRVFGPEQHSGSTWERPGEEWGTGFAFPKKGCWKLELTRTRGSGYVWLPVS
ncbi:hypothetical protein ABT294_02385 [Nonomuraea sp. NPDC000554]|uniref:hypothetical protein n=1 Tax=Nonomuraea sp. NPDC000554 TaxID=3154259 RepID=UPI003319CD22